jgi:hypothetical protein
MRSRLFPRSPFYTPRSHTHARMTQATITHKLFTSCFPQRIQCQQVFSPECTWHIRKFLYRYIIGRREKRGQSLEREN